MHFLRINQVVACEYMDCINLNFRFLFSSVCGAILESSKLYSATMGHSVEVQNCETAMMRHF